MTAESAGVAESADRNGAVMSQTSIVRRRAAQLRPSRDVASRLVDAGFVPLILVALGVALSVASPFFFTHRNLVNILIQAAILGIAAAGATFVILAGDLDLSIGSNIALSGVVAAYGMTTLSHSVTVGVLLGLGTGLAIGAVNGFLATVMRVPSFIATLGTLVIASGAALWVTNGATISGLPDAFGAVATDQFLGLQYLVWIMFAAFAVGYVILHRSTLGIRIFAVGGSKEAARLSGMSVGWVRVLCFLVSGLSGGLAGILLAAQVQSGQPTVGTTLTLYATAAVVLGGTSIFGGQGSIIRTFFGVLLIATVQNGLDILGASYAAQQVAVGVVFVLAASSELIRRKL
jgi:ribose transport system permease protein